MILVMGATGNVGSKIVRHLIDIGHPVRAVARKFPNKKAYKDCDLAIGDANNAAFLTDAMRGCSAVFTMIPENPMAKEARFSQNKIGEVIAEAIEESGVRKVVNLSSVGAELSSGTGAILGLHDQEERLQELTGVDFVHLRCGYFFENFLHGISTMKRMNSYFGTVNPEIRIPMTAAKDIAARAAFLLSNPDFDGHNIEYVLGERDLSFSEAINALGAAIGKKDLKYIVTGQVAAQKALVNAGLTEDWADAMLEMEEAMNNGILKATVARDSANTTATSIEEFARTTFLESYREFPDNPSPAKDMHP